MCIDLVDGRIYEENEDDESLCELYDADWTLSEQSICELYDTDWTLSSSEVRRAKKS